MINLETVVAGDKVFKFEYSRFPQVVEISRVTKDFVFVGGKNHLGEPYEKKYRRDGSPIEKYDKSSLRLIEPGEIEQFEKQKTDEKRINEIIGLLAEKGFQFSGHFQWYSIEIWENLIAVFRPKVIKEDSDPYSTDSIHGEKVNE